MPPLPGPGSELADRLEAEFAEEQAYWQRLFEASRYETVEQLRSAVDLPGWRARDAQKQLAINAARNPSRTVPEQLGSVRGRPSRQVNVKLSLPDFEALKALAVEWDLPPATAARNLIRGALVRAAKRD